MTLFWLYSLFIKKTSIVDFAWGLGFIFLSSIALFYNENVDARKLLVYILIILWGTRLAFYIFLRNKNKPEDFRYQRAKEKWAERFWWKSFLNIFLAQGAGIILVSFSALYIFTYSNKTLGLLDVLGVIIWIIGFYFESIGDWQLFNFKQKPENKGKIMNKGLWKYTRHPNYFGEATMWWGIFTIALSLPGGIITIISAVAITFSLLKVTGVKMLENSYKDNLEYQNYIKETNSFIPWFPKKLKK